MTGQTLGGGIPLVRALPANPTDGAIIAFQDDTTLVDGTNTMAALGITWLLRYNGQSASVYKWEFVGGALVLAAVVTSETTTSTTYAALTTAGPVVTAPLAGDYEVTLGCRAVNNSDGIYSIMSYDIGATGASDNDNIAFRAVGTSTNGANIIRTMIKTGLAALTVLTGKYRVTGGMGTYQDRFIAVRPVRVG